MTTDPPRSDPPPSNPFHHPPDGPLQPGVHPAEWFIDDVGDHGANFEEFRREVGTLDTLGAAGRLVVVEGSKTSGKSTLINRCLHHLLDQDEHRTRVREWDMTTVPTTRQVDSRRQLLTSPELQHAVCSRVVRIKCTFLADEDRTAAKEMLEAREPDIGSVYALISDRLPDGEVAVIRLPKGDPDVERRSLETYAAWTAPNIVFLAERTAPATEAPFRTERDGSREPALVLRLSDLQPDDIRIVVDRRLDRLALVDPAGKLPRAVSGDVINQLATLTATLTKAERGTLGWIVSVFRQIYERRMEEDPAWTTDEITWNEVTDLMTRREL